MSLQKSVILIVLISISKLSFASYLDQYCEKYRDTPIKKVEIESLAIKLNDPDTNVWGGAADRLSCYGKQTEKYIPKMISLFNVNHGEARLGVIESVANYKKVSVHYLIEALASKDIDIRRGSCAALRDIGPAAKDAIPALTVLLEEPGYDVSMEASLAIKRINGK